MRRTLLLVLALPTVLLVAGLVGDADGVRTVDSAAGPDPVDTSDGAGPASAAPVGVGPTTGSGPGPDPSTGPPRGPSPDLDPTPETAPVGPPGLAARSPEGFLIAPGGDVTGSGPRWRYTVEVEPATGLDLATVAADVARALTDPRSWSRTRTLEQVDDPGQARIRLLVATPETVDRLCAQVGLRTNGIFSCWNGRFAAMNSWRWEAGATGFDDLETYRTYLINHEFGHGLGYGHIGCPAPGLPAPVMMQQSKGLGGCVPNGWPYP
jgi:hypothetical protein